MIRRYWKHLLIMALIVLSKLSGLLKDVMLTFYQGASTITDSFFLSTSITSLIYMGIYSAIPILLVPLYSRLRGGKAEQSPAGHVSGGVILLVGISLAVTLLVLAAGPWLVGLVAPTADPAVRQLAGRYLSIMAIGFPISTAVGICNSLQSVDGESTPSYTVPIANNIFFCMGLGMFGAGADFYGVLIFSVLGWLLLLVINGIRVKGSFPFTWGALRDVSRSRDLLWIFVPAAFSFYIEQANTFVGTYFASTLPGHAISIWAYAGKLSLMFLSGFLVYLTTNLFPRIASLLVSGTAAELAAYLVLCVRLVTLMFLPAVVYFGFYSREVVALLFARGKFTPQDAVMVASILLIVLLAVPLSLMRDIMNRVYFAHENTTVPFVLSAFALVLNFGLSYWLARRLGLSGVAIAAVVSVASHSVFLMFLVQRKLKHALLVPAARAFILCGAAVVAALFCLKIEERAIPGFWIVNWIPFGLVYLGLLYVVGLKEVRGARWRLRK